MMEESRYQSNDFGGFEDFDDEVVGGEDVLLVYELVGKDDDLERHDGEVDFVLELGSIDPDALGPELEDEFADEDDGEDEVSDFQVADGLFGHAIVVATEHEGVAEDGHHGEDLEVLVLDDDVRELLDLLQRVVHHAGPLLPLVPLVLVHHERERLRVDRPLLLDVVVVLLDLADLRDLLLPPLQRVRLLLQLLH